MDEDGGDGTSGGGLAAPARCQARLARPAIAVAPAADGAENARTHVFEVDHQGERLGSLRITASPREPLTSAGERLVRAVAGQAGLMLHNAGLIEDLRASRQRLVAATDQARRSLERDLHDGAQQQLVALQMTLGMARQVVRNSPEQAAILLAQTERAAGEVLAELRNLAHGIYPPLLAGQGLGAALKDQAAKAALPVTIEARGVGRYPQEIEAALYFAICEALQNVAKYAQAPAARVTLCQQGQFLAFAVEDDGTGFDRATTPMGTGVQGMADRVAALGGTLEIDSAPGHGTRVRGRVPAGGGATGASGRRLRHRGESRVGPVRELSGPPGGMAERSFACRPGAPAAAVPGRRSSAGGTARAQRGPFRCRLGGRPGGDGRGFPVT